MKIPNFEIPKGYELIKEGEKVPFYHVRTSKDSKEWQWLGKNLLMVDEIIDEKNSFWYFKSMSVSKENPDPTIYSNIIGLSAIRLCESMGNHVAANEVRVLRVILEKFLESEKAKK